MRHNRFNANVAPSIPAIGHVGGVRLKGEESICCDQPKIALGETLVMGSPAFSVYCTDSLIHLRV